MSIARKKERLTVIVPCYNEGEGVERLKETLREELEKLNKVRYTYEIIFVNDGSTDETEDVILKMAKADRHVKYISLSRNFGKESAMLAALEATKGDCAVIMDGDLQHPPHLIHDMLKKYEQGFDQVIAKRNRKGDSFKATFFAKMYYKFVNRWIDVKLVDGAGDFRLLSRAAIDAIISVKETNRFSKGIFTWVGFNQTYIEYENQPRVSNESSWSFKKLLRYGIDGIISFNVQPLRICVYLGSSLLVISMIYLIYLFIRIVLNGIDTPGYFTTITLIAVLGGVQLLSLGIIGEYVGRIYAEVKKRPLYIVKKTNIKKDEESGNGKIEK